MSAPQANWEVISSTEEVGPYCWAAEFGAGYLVVHASPTGSESMVYVPHAVSGLGSASGGSDNEASS